MPDINRVPQGLLSLLDAKTGGRTPADVDSNLQTVVDLTDLYLTDIPLRTSTATQSVGSGDIGTITCVVEVPSNELWFVRGVSGQTVTGGVAGGGYVIALAIDTNTGLGVHFLNTPDQFTTTLQTFESEVAAVNFPTPFVVGPGTRFGIVPCHLFPNVAVCNSSVLYQALEI